MLWRSRRRIDPSLVLANVDPEFATNPVLLCFGWGFVVALVELKRLRKPGQRFGTRLATRGNARLTVVAVARSSSWVKFIPSVRLWVVASVFSSYGDSCTNPPLTEGVRLTNSLFE